MSTRQARREKAVTRSAPGGICRAGSMQFAGPAPGVVETPSHLKQSGSKLVGEAAHGSGPISRSHLSTSGRLRTEHHPSFRTLVSLICPLEHLRGQEHPALRAEFIHSIGALFVNVRPSQTSTRGTQ